MTPEYAAANVDAVIASARKKCLRFIKESEDRFVDSVTDRGGLTTAEAVRVIEEQRDVVLDQLDENMKNLRAWILRGCTDRH